jgi:hypothetical protein
MMLESHQTFATCPNGFHKSPSGDCEAVTSHERLPRCSNGYHRSPSGNCEAVFGNEGNNNNLAGNIYNETNNGQATGIVAESPSNNSTISSISQCDQSLWNHVYNPARLQVVDPLQNSVV